jgi:DNA-directed RNA polymerase subunit E'/Rpb7
MNDIKLDASIANDPSSFSVNRLENRLLSMIPQKSYFSKCLDFFKGKNHRLPFEKLASSLDLLPTWDCVKLTDGSVLKGDIVDFEMTLNSGVKLGRKDFKSLERKNRRFPWLYSKPDYFVAYHELGRAVKLKFSDTHTNVTIKLAGSTRQVVFSLAELSKLELGWVSHMDGVQHSEVQIRQGDVRQGKITGIKDFGVFVRLGNYQDGLIHASTLKGAQLQDFRLDQTVKVKVVHINNEKPKSHIYLQLES